MLTVESPGVHLNVPLRVAEINLGQGKGAQVGN